MSADIINIASCLDEFVDPRASEGGINSDGDVICWPQIVVNNLPKRANKSEIQRYFSSKVTVPIRKLKIVPGKTFCFVTFEKEEHKTEAVEQIKANKFREFTLDPVNKTYVQQNQNNRDSRDSRDRQQQNKQQEDKKRAVEKQTEAADNEDADESRDRKRARGDDDDKEKSAPIPNPSATAAVGLPSVLPPAPPAAAGVPAGVPVVVSAAPAPVVSAVSAACPLWDMTYPEQLVLKTESMRKDCLQALIRSVKQCYKTGGDSNSKNRHHQQQISNAPEPMWVHDLGLVAISNTNSSSSGNSSGSSSSATTSDAAAIDRRYKLLMEPIKPSPAVVGYRNKCEFTFGNVDGVGSPAVCGFRCSSFGRGSTVAAPYDCPNVPNAKKLLVFEMLRFLNSEQSTLPVFDNNTRKGVYRLLTTRYSKATGNFVAMLCINLREERKAAEAEKAEQNGNNNGDGNADAAGLTSSSASTTAPRWAQQLTLLSEHLKSLRRPVDLDNEDGQLMQRVLAGEAVQYSDKPLLSGLSVQVFEGLSVPLADHRAIRIFGKGFCTEYLLGCQFRVSPQSFFQVNTLAAEVLYQTVIDVCKLDTGAVVPSSSSSPQSSCILDICCGTGTIGICASKQLQGINADMGSSKTSNIIVGVDSCASAIVNANINARLNGIRVLSVETEEERKELGVEAAETAVSTPTLSVEACQAVFVASRAEAVLGTLLRSLHNYENHNHNNSSSSSSSSGSSSKDSGSLEKVQALLSSITAATGKPRCYAIVDPPREGMHNDCLRAIRACRAIDRLVYISCNPTKSLVRDAAVLCASGSPKAGLPFRPMQAFPVDLFPYTPHCEMVLVFDRVTAEEQRTLYYPPAHPQKQQQPAPATTGVSAPVPVPVATNEPTTENASSAMAAGEDS